SETSQSSDPRIPRLAEELHQTGLITMDEEAEESESEPNALLAEQERIVGDLCTRFKKSDDNTIFELCEDTE
ncbi:hypothetical protein PENTCL1PPCAC_10220, partial [Pristionchus entomophagus]